MSNEKLEVRVELDGCTLLGGVTIRNRLELHVYGHGMDTDDQRDAEKIATLLTERGTSVRQLKCPECSDCAGIALNHNQRAFEGRLGQIMQAACDVLHLTGEGVELTFNRGKQSFIFSAKWTYVGGSQYCLNNVWTYYVKNPADELLANIRSIAGVQRVDDELLDTGTTALDIMVFSSRHGSLESCLSAVIDVLVA